MSRFWNFLLRSASARVRMLGVLAWCFCAFAAHAGDVLTQSYDNHRSGANLHETALNTRNVGPRTFGRLASLRVDGPVFSQPLVAAQIALGDGTTRDLVYVTTANNSVFAFDANGDAQSLIWRREFGRLPDGRIAAVGGILSTPVIDRASHAIYVVTGHMDDRRGRFVLHALDLSTGEERPGAPLLIEGAVKVDDSLIAFEPTDKRIAVQRAALSIAQRRLVVAFGGDFFEGWIFSYDVDNLRATPHSFCTTCASRVRDISRVDYLDSRCTLVGPGGGIWQAGRAPAIAEDGTIYFFTGNKQHIVKDGCLVPPGENACAVCAKPEGCLCKGNRASAACRGHDACEANASRDARVFDTHDAMIALSPALELKGWYRPANWNASGVNGLEYNDLDLGGSGPVLLPHSSRLLGGGKQGVMYMLDTRGSETPCLPTLSRTCIAPEPVQSFQVAPIPPRPNEYHRHILGGPVLWTRSATAGGSVVFIWRVNDTLRSYALTDRFEGCDTANPAPTTTHRCEARAVSEDYIEHHPGGILSLSAQGEDPDSAILWVSKHSSLSGPARLMAFRAQPESATPGQLTKIWDSSMCLGDGLESGSEFMPATIANGRVFLPTGNGTVEVFGLVATRECVPAPLPANLGPMLQ